MNNKKIKFSIIIPTFNRAESLKITFLSLIHLNFEREKFEIIIVDNGSIDNTKEVVKGFIKENPTLSIVYIYESNPGVHSARHTGVFQALGEILIFIDDDISVSSEWLRVIEKSFSNKSIQIAGGKNLPEYEDTPPQWIEWFWIKNKFGKFCWELSLLDFGNKAFLIDPIFVFSENLAIRKKTLLDLKGFHPDNMPNNMLHLQGDGETGLMKKANQVNCKTLYQPEMVVYHRISKKRMTEEYFCKRYFNQGVASSYVELRNRKFIIEKKEKILQMKFIKIRKILGKIKRLLFAYFIKVKKIEVNPKLKQLKNTFEKSKIEGYNFHQNKALLDPKLLEWILREDYMYK